MKIAIISQLCAFMVFLSVYLPLGNAYLPGQMSVTPPADGGDEQVERDADGCYDRSDVPVDGVWSRFCKPFRQHCLPSEAAGIENTAYFRSRFTDILKTNPDVDLNINSLAELDAEFEKSYLMNLLEKISEKGTERAKKCLEYGIYFLCNTVFPMCASHGKFMKIVLPCRETCQLTRNQCEEELKEAGYIWSPLFECNSFPSIETDPSCTPLNTLVDCPIQYNLSNPNTTYYIPPPVVTEPPSTPSDNNTTSTNATTPTNTTAITPDQPTDQPPAPTPMQCPSDTTNRTLLKMCDCKKKVRENFSKQRLAKAKYDFFAYVKVINRYITVLEGQCRYAYNVSITNNYYPDCTSTEYGCATNTIATVYTGDSGDGDCCVTPFFRLCER